jgi:hypothetical protein
MEKEKKAWCLCLFLWEAVEIQVPSLGLPERKFAPKYSKLLLARSLVFLAFVFCLQSGATRRLEKKGRGKGKETPARSLALRVLI